MRFLNLARKNKEVSPESWEQLYSRMIVKRIRQKYSLNAELAILRQRDSKPEEFKTYSDYVEQCKASVKTELSQGGEQL